MCNAGHDEIIYDVRRCPMCEVLKDNTDLHKEIAKLQNELEEAYENHT